MLHLLVQHPHPFDDRAVEVRGRVARAAVAEGGDAAPHVASERDHPGQVRAAVEHVDRDLLVRPDPVTEG